MFCTKRCAFYPNIYFIDILEEEGGVNGISKKVICC